MVFYIYIVGCASFYLFFIFFILIFFFRQFLTFAKKTHDNLPTAFKSSETDVAKVRLFVITSEVLGNLPRVHVNRLAHAGDNGFSFKPFLSSLPVGTNSVNICNLAYMPQMRRKPPCHDYLCM